jgi:hypothetical protein
LKTAPAAGKRGINQMSSKKFIPIPSFKTGVWPGNSKDAATLILD